MRKEFKIYRFDIEVRGYIEAETGQVGWYDSDGTDRGGDYPPNPFCRDVHPVDYRHFESIKDSFFIDLNYNNLAEMILELGDESLSFGRVPASLSRIYYNITVNP